MRSLARRLSASKPLFVAPTGLRDLPRLRPHPRLDLRLRRAHYGFPSPIASFWSRLTITHAKFAVDIPSDRAPSGIACRPRTPSVSSPPSPPSSSRSSFAPSAPDPRPHAAAIIAIHDAISILRCLYAGASPPASSPDTYALPVPTLAVLLQLRSPCFLPYLALLPPPPRTTIPPLSTLTSRATHGNSTSPRSTGFCAIWDCISSSSFPAQLCTPSPAHLRERTHPTQLPLPQNMH